MERIKGQSRGIAAKHVRVAQNKADNVEKDDEDNYSEEIVEHRPDESVGVLSGGVGGDIGRAIGCEQSNLTAKLFDGIVESIRFRFFALVKLVFDFL